MYKWLSVARRVDNGGSVLDYLKTHFKHIAINDHFVLKLTCRYLKSDLKVL